MSSADPSSSPSSLSLSPSSSASRYSFVLYSYFRSSCSWRVRQVLLFKSIPHQLKFVHLVKGQQLSGEHQLRNPMKAVPVLEVRDQRTNECTFIAQSLAIIDFLNQLFPEPPVYPASPLDRALTLSLALIVIADTQPVTNLKILGLIDRLAGAEEKTAWAANLMTNGLTAFETELRNRNSSRTRSSKNELEKNTADSNSSSDELSLPRPRYCVGSSISLADFCVSPQLYNARRLGIPVESLFPLMCAIESELMDFLWFKQAHADTQEDNDVNQVSINQFSINYASKKVAGNNKQ